MGKVIDLIGQKFGRLTVIEYRGVRNTFARWLCQCDCGNRVEVVGISLRTGNTRSCGCLCRELSSKRLLKRSGGTLGESRSRLCGVWRTMLQRCDNQSHTHYHIYGGRGITVCNEWRDYANFKAWALANGYDESAPRGKCTLDRIDNNGNYEPSNCRWIDMREQCKNRRNPTQIFEYGGVRHTLSEWADIVGLKTKVIRERLRNGWEMEKALYTPVLK